MSDIEKNSGSQHHEHRDNGFATRPGPLAAKGAHIANPGPLGLFSFASTTFILSMYNIQTRGISHPNAVVGMAAGCGGLTQLLAGMWEFPKGNTFGGSAFSSYGAFWIAYAFIQIPGSGIRAAYADPVEFRSAVAIFLTCWAMVTFWFFIASLRKNIGFIALFGFLTMTFIILAAGDFTGHLSVTKAGGVLGVITAFIAYYLGLSDLLAAEKAAVVRLPLGVFKHD